MDTDGSRLKELVCVEFPGTVQNVDKMIDALGGIQVLNDTYNSINARLELRFRPQSTYCHGVFGDRNTTQHLMVKFKRKTTHYSDGSTEVSITPQIIGYIGTTYVFESLVDFQYLPMVKGSDGNYESILEKILPSNPFDPTVDCPKFDENAPVFILPAIFSRFDSPLDYSYRDGPRKTEPVQSDLNNSPTKDHHGRKSRSVDAIFVNWSNKSVPTEPIAPALEKLKLIQDRSAIDKVKNLYEERPMWSRSSIMYQTKMQLNTTKWILPTIAYHFNDGPYRNLWVKFGYDPRQHKESFIYQSLDFRMKTIHKGIPLDELMGKNRRSLCQYQLPLRKTDDATIRRSRGSMAIADLDATIKAEEMEEAEKEEALMTELAGSIYFKPGQIPSRRQCNFCLCDIDLPLVQDILSKPITKAAPDEKDGWLEQGTMDNIRKAMAKEVERALDSAMAEMNLLPGTSSSSDIPSLPVSSIILDKEEYAEANAMDEDQGMSIDDD